jgi:hypothetical protein
MSLSDRAENLEAIEARLKADILEEAERYSGFAWHVLSLMILDTVDSF